MRTTIELRRQALADRLSALRTDGVLAQGARFAISGALVSAVYISITTLLSSVSHMRFQIALAIGWMVAIAVHFTLQRTFVWARSEAFALTFRHQIGRYLLVACAQLGVSLSTTAVLPGLLGVSAELVYLATAVLITACNFLVFRTGVFHGGHRTDSS